MAREFLQTRMQNARGWRDESRRSASPRAAIGVSLSTIHRFVNHGAKIQSSKLAQIGAALARLDHPKIV
jgi:hypothetical protein